MASETPEGFEGIDTGPDSELWDNTDGAHPAFWRGQEDGVRGAVDLIHKALDGDNGGVCANDRLQSARDRIAALLKRVEELETQCQEPKETTTDT